MAVLNLRDVPDELARELRVEAAQADMGVREYCVTVLSSRKKIADISAGVVAQDGGVASKKALPRGGKTELAGIARNISDGMYPRTITGEAPRWSEEHMKKMAESEPGGLMACSPELLTEMKEGAKTDGGVAAKLHLAGVELDREILVRWGLVENYKQKMGEINGGVEIRGAAGKDRRNSEAVPENNYDGKDAAVGVGKPKVDMDALRNICAGKLGGQDDSIPESIEVDLCGFKSYNDVDGENYICGKENHGPKIKHGDWIKI